MIVASNVYKTKQILPKLEEDTPSTPATILVNIFFIFSNSEKSCMGGSKNVNLKSILPQAGFGLS